MNARARRAAVLGVAVFAACGGDSSGSCPIQECRAKSAPAGVAGYSTRAGGCGTELATVGRDYALFVEAPPPGSTGIPVVASGVDDGYFELPAAPGAYELCFGGRSAFDDSFKIGTSGTVCVDVAVGSEPVRWDFSEDTLDFSGPIAEPCISIECCPVDARATTGTR